MSTDNLHYLQTIEAPREENGTMMQGCKFVRWWERNSLDQDLNGVLIQSIRAIALTAFYLVNAFGYWPSNNMDGTTMLQKSNVSSPFFNNMSGISEWVHKHEAVWLSIKEIKSPNMKWSFIGFDSMD